MGFYTNFILLPLLVIGLILGIFSISNHEDAALYGVSIIFLIEVNNTVSTGLRQIIINENIMISFERLLTITNLKSEKDLITEYDIDHEIPINNERNQQNNSLDVKAWPEKPNIIFKNLNLRYRP